ncbi:efflux transporter outer membrane subunit [Bremerella alba]|uniref:Solvent efflux pump outer membrane protein SrpC n=1 Tax=Bremerella alba TaxID=980252 RepID=A0A7V9A7L4_9BACT|nr:efflux transporter outer membrane subunit [Bremerella alba]MBA2115403.1 Solvent efflux pump outer membrane protein SrpC [Bremerella alba]
MLQLLGSGCAGKESAVTLPTQAPPPFSESGEAPLREFWWTTFDDPELDQQVDIALRGNFDLEGALQRILQAQSVARREASDLWPDVDGVASAESNVRTDGPNTARWVLGLDASYQVDLWGEIGSRVDAQWLRASATEADFNVVALTLSADVARTWYALIEANAQIELLDEQIRTNLTGLEIQEARFGLGQIRSADVLRQRQLVEATREQRVVVTSRIEVLEHLLAVLQGVPPQEASFSPGAQLPMLPPLPETGLPSELLNRRPDIRREFLALWAADRDLASAVSAQYPRLNLAGSITTAAESPENLFREWYLSVAGQLIAPLIDGGERRAEVNRNMATVRLRFTEFSQTVLIAYQEVEDALTRERYQRQRIEKLEAQAKLAHQASIQLREQYLIGETEYLDVLSSMQQEQSLQRTVLSARLNLILNRIALYLALAGDFDPQQAYPLANIPLEYVDGVPIEIIEDAPPAIILELPEENEIDE